MKRILIILLVLVVTINANAFRVYANQISNPIKVNRNTYEVTVSLLNNTKVKCYVSRDMLELIKLNQVVLKLIKKDDLYLLLYDLSEYPHGNVTK